MRARRETPLSRLLKEKRRSLKLSTTDIETLTKDQPAKFRISQSFAWGVEHGSLPSPYKLLSLARVLGLNLETIFKILGATDSEICGHTLTPQQQAVVDQLNTDSGEYLLKLRWLLAEGRESQKQVIRGMLDELAREAPADDLQPPAAVVDLTDHDALAADTGPGTRPIPVHRLQSAAGGGAVDLDETIKTFAYFRQEWLSRKGLNPSRCNIINVMGESMEPTLPDGCVILLDRNRTRRRRGHIFVVRTEDGLIVKFAGKDKDGGWQLASDHPSWKPLRWPDQAEVIGEVKWMAREL